MGGAGTNKTVLQTSGQWLASGQTGSASRSSAVVLNRCLLAGKVVHGAGTVGSPYDFKGTLIINDLSVRPFSYSTYRASIEINSGSVFIQNNKNCLPIVLNGGKAFIRNCSFPYVGENNNSVWAKDTDTIGKSILLIEDVSWFDMFDPMTTAAASMGLLSIGANVIYSIKGALLPDDCISINANAKEYHDYLKEQSKVTDMVAYNSMRVITDGCDIGAVSPLDTKEPTGFIDPSAVTVSYDSTERKITLTGTLSYYWRGTKVTLTSPWTSSAHNSGDGSFYLSSSDGVNFTWSNSLWALSAIQVAFVIVAQSGAVKLGIRECHGLMPWNTHETLHYTVGSYLKSGGRLDGNTYTENTASDAGTTPGLLEAVIADEDLDSTIAAWTQGTYTTMRIGASGVATFDTSASFPFRSSGSYILVNTTSTGAEAATVQNRYVNVYTIMLPVTSDAGSQAYRVLWLQPQAAYTSLAAAQAEDPRSLALGTLSSLSPEFTITSRITYVTAAGDSNTGKCRIATGGVTYLSGGRHSLVSVSGVTASTAGNIAVVADSTGLVTGNVQDSLENLASQFAPVAFSSLPTASANTGYLRQITDWGYPYALVQSNGSAWVQFTRPRSTWANLPAAASWTNWTVLVTDIPLGGSSEWYSNGSDWFPVGGQVVLEAADFSDPANSGLGTLSTTSQTQANITGWSLTLPANITKGVGTTLSVRGRFARAPNINSVGAKAGFIFTDISNTIPVAWMGNISANNNGIRLENIIGRVSNNKVQVGQSGATPTNINQYQWNTSTQAGYSGYIAYDEASAATLYPAGLVTSTSGDTIYLQSVVVTLHKVPQ